MAVSFYIVFSAIFKLWSMKHSSSEENIFSQLIAAGKFMLLSCNPPLGQQAKVFIRALYKNIRWAKGFIGHEQKELYFQRPLHTSSWLLAVSDWMKLIYIYLRVYTEVEAKYIYWRFAFWQRPQQHLWEHRKHSSAQCDALAMHV